MDGTSYNLLDRPWVRVRTREGTLEELGLLETLRRAPDLEGLAGEIPTQDTAVLRTILAVLHRALPPDPDLDDDEAGEVWHETWTAGSLPMDRIEPYLDRWRHRFDLLDPSAPFGQVADLHTPTGRWSGLTKLLADHPDGVAHFTMRGGTGLTSLTLAESARWLVHCHAFDPSGIKTGAVGDSRVKGGKGYPIGTGWCGALGMFVLQGRTLFETLLLNLVLPASGPDDLPVWERPPLGPGEETGHVTPRGPADLMTWPSRRIRLQVEDGRATDVLIGIGDRIETGNQHRAETMSAWRDSEAQAKKHGFKVIMPRVHVPARAVWRGLPATLLAHEGITVPLLQTQAWLALLTERGHLPRDYPVRVRAVGLVYGSQNSVVIGSVDDVLTLHNAVLSEPRLREAARTAVVAADGAAASLGWFGEMIFEAGGGDGVNEAAAHREQARETAYTLLDRPCRRALSRLGVDTDRQAWQVAWQREVRRIVLTESSRMIDAAGRPALVGRAVSTGDGTSRQVDAASAQARLHHELRKHLPLAYTDQPRVSEGEAS